MKKYISFVMAVILITVSISNVICVSAADNVIQGEDITMQNNSVSNKESSYSNYEKTFSKAVNASDSIKVGLNGVVLSSQPIEFSVSVPNDGLYTLGINYKSADSGRTAFRFGFLLDGKYPYNEAALLSIPRMWTDDEAAKKTDSSGNEFAPRQVEYADYRFAKILNNSSDKSYPYMVYLSAGAHNVKLIPKSGSFSIDYFEFGNIIEPNNYKVPDSKNNYYDGEKIIIEGESAVLKSDYFFSGKTDSSTVKVTPYDPSHNVINYIGGGNWKSSGDTIIWETPELEEGYYGIGFSFRQNYIIGGKTYRLLSVDGEIPFSEAAEIDFTYGDSWQKKIFSDENGSPYLLHFSEGKHEIALTVVSGGISDVRDELDEAVSMLGEMYLDITAITGETVDVYRDYNLFSQIPNMENRLKEIKEKLVNTAEDLKRVTKQKSGSNYSVINNMAEVINQMLKNKFEAHRYKSSYYTNYCSLSSVLQDLRNMPLDIDKIYLLPADDNSILHEKSFGKQLAYSVKRFFTTFVRDYSGVSETKNEDGGITVWVNWGRDQAQVLSSLISRLFTPQTGIAVNLQLVNVSVVQAVLSGNGPDCILQITRSEPVNLAMRGVLYDLSDFADCDKVLDNFQKNADVPYRYKDGLYALPDTQTFFMMFYRTDILEKFGITPPETWEDFEEAAKILMRNNMSVWLPNNVATDTSQSNAGVGSNNIFPSLLLQNKIPLYAESGKKTNLTSAEAMEIFGTWTDFYNKLSIPVSMDFYNRFRIGTTPLGISVYTLYTTLKVAAPEIDGLWGFKAIPGTVGTDGSVSHATSGGGTACAILKQSKSPKKAWEFLKWWTGEEAQLNFSNEVEAILGPTGRIALSNVAAIKGLSWDDGMLDELIKAWSNVEEISEYPGSYYVSRSIYQSFWNVVNDNQNVKDVLIKYSKEADDEMTRKWKQYANR